MKAFDQFDGDIRARLLAVKDLIHATAKETPGVGAVVEDVKWGQPSFATTPRTGTPIRLGVNKAGAPALFVHCQTTVVADYVAGPGTGALIEGNRAVILPADLSQLVPLIRAALTYHIRSHT
ncbi:MAG: DUF1801 domain-containing protein [Pikeienuella sp.]